MSKKSLMHETLTNLLNRLHELSPGILGDIDIDDENPLYFQLEIPGFMFRCDSTQTPNVFKAQLSNYKRYEIDYMLPEQLDQAARDIIDAYAINEVKDSVDELTGCKN